MAAYFAKPPMGSRLQRGDPLAHGLVAAYCLNEGSGLTAYDGTGRTTQNATLTNGPTWGNALWGKCLTFDGSNDYLSCPVAAAKINTGFTLVLDVTATIATGGSTSQYPADYGDSDDIFGVTWTHANATYQGAFYMKGGGAYPAAKWGTAVAGERVSIAATWDGSTMSAYKNGLLNATASNSTFGSTSNGLYLGGAPTAGVYWPGNVHAALVYSRPLSAAQIRALAADPFRMFRRRRVPVPVRPRSGGAPATATYVVGGGVGTASTVIGD